MLALKPNEHSVLVRSLRDARPQRLRSMREFAEHEIVIPDGPFEGRRFSCHRQPYTAEWFRLVDSKNWIRHVATGPTQSGKSLSAFVIPTLYHLFEYGETVICGLPDMDMASDKWQEDFLPAIERTRYRDLLPVKGRGSKGGKVSAIRFRNGTTLRFLSGGGGDKSRAGFTARVLVVTETDGMDTSSDSSREADKITQLEARTRAYGARRRIYMECTVSVEEGRTWREYKAGTESRLALPCPHCGSHVSPERDSLLGWQSAENVVEARRRSAFYCPGCGQEWKEEHRRIANEQGVTLHRGQEMGPDRAIRGDSPPTETLGFRWSAVNNLFVTAGDVGADEWQATRSANEDNAERELRQFVWAVPHIPPKLDLSSLSFEQISRRVIAIPRGIVPSDCLSLSAAIDIGKYLAHWIAIAWCQEERCHVVDYGRLEVPGAEMAVEKAILVALRQFRDLCELGWKRPDGSMRPPELVLIDSGYQAPTVYGFVKEAGRRFMPAIGRGSGQQSNHNYQRPKGAGSQTIWTGDGCHVSRLEVEGVDLVEANADFWKSFLHARIATPLSTAGALSLFNASPEEHLSLAKHLTSEKQVEEFLAGKGTVVRWVRQSRNNHWFDAAYNACVAGCLLGIRSSDSDSNSPDVVVNPPVTRPDGRGWLDV